MAREEDSFALGQSGSALGLYRMLGAGSTIEKVSDLIAVARKIERYSPSLGPSRRSARTQNLQGMRARLPEGKRRGRDSNESREAISDAVEAIAGAA